MFLANMLNNSIEKTDRCDMGMPANGSVAFSIFSISIYSKNTD